MASAERTVAGGKEKGFGKILPSAAAGQLVDEAACMVHGYTKTAGLADSICQVFVHKSRFEGGPEGPHAQAGRVSMLALTFANHLCYCWQAVSEGVLVTYEVITSQVDGKPTACNVQVRGSEGMHVLQHKYHDPLNVFGFAGPH